MYRSTHSGLFPPLKLSPKRPKCRTISPIVLFFTNMFFGSDADRRDRPRSGNFHHCPPGGVFSRFQIRLVLPRPARPVRGVQVSRPEAEYLDEAELGRRGFELLMHEAKTAMRSDSNATSPMGPGSGFGTDSPAFPALPRTVSYPSMDETRKVSGLVQREGVHGEEIFTNPPVQSWASLRVMRRGASL